jgi:hypothetical protein
MAFLSKMFGGSFTEEHYIPDLRFWENTGVSNPGWGSIIRIGQNLYSFGSSSSTHILTSPWNDCLNWTDTGKTCPGNSGDRWRLAIIGDYLWVFGRQNTINDSSNAVKIYNAPLSDPTTWTQQGTLIDGCRSNADYAIVDGYVVILTTEGNATFAFAPTSNPTSFSTKSIASFPWMETVDKRIVAEPGYFITDNKLHLIMRGGITNVAVYPCNCIYDATTLTGKNYWFDMGFFPDFGLNLYNYLNNPQFWNIGNYMYMFATGGGNTYSTIGACKIKDLDNKKFDYINTTFNYNQYGFRYLGNCGQWIGSDGRFYSLSQGGTIMRSHRMHVLSEPQNLTTLKNLQAVTDDGLPTMVTKSCQLGYKEWITNRTDWV